MTSRSDTMGSSSYINGESRSFTAVAFSDVRAMVYIAYCAVLGVSFPFVASKLPDPGFLTSLALAYGVGVAVPLCMVLGKRIDLVEPIYWFSAKYYLVFPGAIYFLLTGFAHSEHLLNPGLLRLQKLTEQALILFLVGYLCYLAGHVVFMRDRGRRVLYVPSREQVTGWVAYTAIAICIGIGAANFCYFLINYAGGGAAYLLDFGRRSHRYDLIEGNVTTIGYQFLYAATYLWFMMVVRNGSLYRRSIEGWMFIGLALLSVFVSFSQGRLNQSISFALILLFMSYVCSPYQVRNYRFLFLTGGGLLLGILLYFLRRVSVAAYGGTQAISMDSLVQYGKAFLPGLGYWLFDKGNVPNLAVVINLLGQDGIAGEQWYGWSYVAWVTNLSNLFGSSPGIGDTVATVWFGREGGLPPTIIGEMFVNFGYIGIPAGMFVVGLLSSWFYGFVRARGDFIWYVVYLALLFKFIFLWPKGEMTNLVAAVWHFVPFVAIYGLVRLVSSARPGSVAVSR